MYKKYIENSENTVQTVFFDKNIVENPQIGDLAKYTEETFSGTNTVKDKILNFEKEKSSIINKYSFVKNVNVDIINNNTLQIGFDFKIPKLEIMGSGLLYAIYSENNIKKFSLANTSGLNINLTGTNKIHLPRYLHDQDMKGVFYKNNFQKVEKYINRIKETFPDGTLFFLAGGENIKVKTPDKSYFFSMDKDIEKQITQYELIKQKASDKLEDAQIVDLGNLDEGVYLKKRGIGR